MKKHVFIAVAAVLLTAAIIAAAILLYRRSLEKKPFSSCFSLVKPDDMLLPVGESAQLEVMTQIHGNNRHLIAAQRKKLASMAYRSSDPSVVTVSPEGTLKALSAGSAQITVSVDDLSQTFTVESYYKLEAIQVASESITLEPGMKEALSVSYLPENASHYGALSFESFAPDIVSVDESGLLTARTIGAAEILVTCDSCSCQVNVNVYQPIEGICFTTQTDRILQGETFRFAAAYIPDTVSEPEPITYSVTENIGTVSENGLFTASGAGDGVITATCGAFRADLPVHVIVPLQGLAAPKAMMQLAPPKTQQVPITLVPENATDYPPIVYQSSNPAVATVNEKGLVTAVSNGTCEITATCGDFSVSVGYRCTIPLERMDISCGNLCLGVGSTFPITATPFPANAPHGPVQWSVQNPAVASVANGVITGLSEGSTAVAVHCDGLSSVISVRVQTKLSAAGQQAANNIISFAKQFIGTPYVYGGNSLTGGIDCSAFTQQCFAQAGITLPRVSYAQATCGTQVSMDPAAWLPGDLIFFQSGGRVSHVAIYIGGGQMIHANESLTNSVAISATSYTSSKGLITPCLVRRFIY